MLPVNGYLFETDKNNVLPRLTKSKIKRIEEADLFSNYEKIEVLLILLHKKWVGEANIQLDNIGNRKSEEILHFLRSIGLAAGLNSYVCDRGEYSWVQIAATEAILDYVLSRRDELTVLEAGVLYGYPVSHSLGYMKLLEQNDRPVPGLAEYTFGGVYSEPCLESERQYFRSLWGEIEAVSPLIAQTNKKEYAEYLREYAKPR
jgi:hypothetical protein